MNNEHQINDDAPLNNNSNDNAIQSGKLDDRSHWERDLLSRLAMSSLNEQRRARRWSIFFKALTFIYLAILLVVIADPDWDKPSSSDKHTAVVDLSGIISPGARASANTINTGLRAAFKDENTVAVIIRISSPGGSPVQSGYIYDEMIRLREEYPDKPLYAVIGDMGASGGYYVAAGAEKIYADKASVVGSIGVRMDSFGFVDAMKMLGIERRLMTAGNSKGLLDPFLPQDDSVRQHMQTLLDDIHQQFISAVRNGRGDRLKELPEMFEGLIWTGEQSLELGLIDGLGDAQYIAREIVKQETLRNFTPKEDILQRFARDIGASITNTLVNITYTQKLN